MRPMAYGRVYMGAGNYVEMCKAGIIYIRSDSQLPPRGQTAGGKDKIPKKVSIEYPN